MHPRRLCPLLLALALYATPATYRDLLAAPAEPRPSSSDVAAVMERAHQARQAGKLEDSLRLYNEALARYEALSDQLRQAQALNFISLVYSAMGQPQKALEFYHQALALRRAVGDKEGEARTLNDIGIVHARLGQPQKAMEFLNQALPLRRAAGDKAGEAATLNAIGAVYHKVGQVQEALDYHRQALTLYRAIGNKAGEASALSNIGAVYAGMGQPQKALEFYRQALPLIQAVGDKAGEATTLSNIGGVHNRTGQPQKALEFLNQALPLLQAVGDKGGEATMLSNIGAVHSRTGQPQKALEYFRQALPLHRAVGNKADEATTLNSIGFVYAGMGQPQKALEFLNQALPLRRAVGDRAGEATTLNNIGAVYNRFGQPQKALEYFRQALPLYRAVGDKAGEANTLSNIGAGHSETGQPQEALEYLRQALSLRRAVGDKGGEASTLHNIGAVYAGMGQPQKALEFYRQALPLIQAVGDKAGEATTLGSIGGVHNRTGQPQKALEYFRQALPLHRAVGDKAHEATTLSNIALAEEALGRRASGRAHLHNALAILEAMREGLGGLSEAKVSFLASHLDNYHQYIYLVLKERDPAAAFAWSEKSKARALLDLMAAGKVDLTHGAIPQDQQQRLRELQRRTAQLNREWVTAGLQRDTGEARLPALKQQVQQAEGDLQKFTDLLYARYPDLARNTAARTVTLADVARFLPADTALLDYVVLRARDLDQTVLFCVTVANGKPVVTAHRIAKPRAELAEKVDDFREACADPQREYRAKARELYNLLLAPAVKQLGSKKRLIVCPDGPLWGLPFQALLAGGGAAGGPAFLAERFEIDYAYSATAVQAALLAKRNPQRPKPTGTLLAFANPDFGTATVPQVRTTGEARPILADARPLLADARDLFLRGDGSIRPLPGTQAEADALQADFADAVIYTGKQARKALAIQEAGRYRYLHFATHGLLNDAAPLMSAVVLAQPPAGADEDQFLTAREIFDLKLSAEMVVLSACNTARGQKQAGEGIVGLTWALFVAGAPTQVVSQWAVNDTSTATLMKAFYGQLKGGKSKGAALRGAELALMKSGPYGHPYYWAPFILLGDWR